MADARRLQASGGASDMRLLMCLWSAGGSLPEDDRKLRRIAGVDRGWPKVWDAIKHHFVCEDGRISNSRLTEEMERARTKSTANARNGARGGKAKALKTREQGLADATTSPERSPYQPEPEPEPEDIPDGISPPMPPSNTKPSPATPQRAASGAARKAARKAGPIPEDWAPDQTSALKLKQHFDLTNSELQFCLDQMKDHAHAKGRNQKDWNASFRQWVRKGIVAERLPEA